MKRLIPLLLSLVCGFAQAAGTVPNIFATMPSGNVAASTLDVNFALISNANTFSTYLTDTGGANAYVVAMPSGQTATLAAGLAVQFKASADNTGASTLNVAGTGVKNIVNFDGTALSAGQIKTGGIVAVQYDGAAYQLGSGGAIASSASTATKLTTGRTIGMTGDLTWTSPAFDGTANVTAVGTLATVNTNVGSFGSSTAIPTITANGKGQITAISDNVVIAPAGTLTGDLVVGSFNSGTGASPTTYWRGDMTWATPGGAGAPGGATTNIQVNDAGAFYGDAGLVYAKASGSVAMGVANTGTTQLSVSNSNAGAGANVQLAMGTTAGAFILQIPSSAAATAAFMAGPSGAGLDIYTVGANALGLGVNSTPTAIVINAAGTLTTIGNTLAMGANNITSTGSLGATGARLTKGWFADLEVTNAIVGGITGNAVTATTATNIAGGAGGSIPYQSAAATTALLANGTAGYVLTSQGTTLAPVWSAAGTGTVTHTLGNLISGNFVLGNGVADAKDAGWAIVPVVNGGTGVTTSTGTGAVVLNTSPTFTTTAGIGSSGTRSNPGDGILFKSYGAGNSYWLLNAATNFNSAVYFGDPASDTVGGIEYLHNGDILKLRVNSATALSIGSTGAVTIPGTLALSPMTSGSVLFAGASGVLAQDNANFFWDVTNHRLGIGNAAPGNKLDVRGGAYGNNQNFGIDIGTPTGANGWLGGMRIKSDAGGIQRLSIDSPSNATFGTTEAISISGGNVGINTASPSAKLSINGGLHVGGTSDPGDNNALIDGTLTSTSYLYPSAGIFMPENQVISWASSGGTQRATITGANTSEIVFTVGSFYTEKLRIGGVIQTNAPIRLNGTTSGYSQFQAPATGANISYTLPGADGSAGYVLVTDGAGVMSWTAGGSGTVTHTLGALTTGNFVLGNGGADVKDAGWAIVPVVNGGTALSTIANAAVLVTNSANTLTALTAGASQSIRRNTGNTAWEAYTSPWTYTNVPATASRHEHNITANLDPATDAVHIGDQSFGPLVIPGTAQLTAISRWGIQAIVGTSTTGGLSNTYIGAIPADALMSTSAAYLLTDHDSTQGGQNIGSWGAYIEARGSAGLTSTVGVTWGIELTTQNLSGTASIPITSNYYTGGRNISGMLIEAAGSSIGATTYNSSAAVVIGANLTFDGATTAGSFVVGDSYQIVTAGTTDFTLLGAANSNVGTKFTATGVGTGTGTASRIVEFNKGILFLDYSLATNNGNMEAIAMSANHQLTWTALGATTPVGRLSSDGTHLTWASNGTTPKVKAPQFESTIATGAAPLVIASTTRVANLQSQYAWGLGSHAGASDTTDPANSNVFLYWNTGTNKIEFWVDITCIFAANSVGVSAC